MLRFRLLFIVPLLIIIFAAPLTYAADFNVGLAAAKSGDFTTAIAEWVPLAEQGHSTAQYNLGLMYYRGEGVPQDYSVALKWYTAAAENGSLDAKLTLGEMYYKGKGAPQDYIRAHMWLNLAAVNGNEAAINNREIVAGTMTASQVQEAQTLARQWAEKH